MRKLLNPNIVIPVLFCTADSIYKKLGCDVYDQKRDALKRYLLK